MNPSTPELIALLVARHFTDIPNPQLHADVLDVAAGFFLNAEQQISMRATAKAIRQTEQLQMDLPTIITAQLG